LKGSKHSSQCHPHDAALVNELSLYPWGWRQGVAHPKHCTLPPHEEATLPSWLPLPWPSPLPSPLPSPTPTPLPSPSPLPLQLPIAVAAAVGHCYGCREPLPLPSLSRRRQPSLSSLPLQLDIALSVIVGHRSCHCRQLSPLPCHRLFPRVVALARQELYSTNRSKECLPYFILLEQWVVY
jgi:hypothetical protein